MLRRAPAVSANPNALAIHGGTPVRSKPFAIWPQTSDIDEQNILKSLQNHRWCTYDGEFIPKFEKAWGCLARISHHEEEKAGFNVAVIGTSNFLPLASCSYNDKLREVRDRQCSARRFAVGLKPRPSGRLVKTSDCGENSGLLHWRLRPTCTKGRCGLAP